MPYTLNHLGNPMKLDLLKFTIAFLTGFSAFGQFNTEKIETDSTEIEITKNSTFKIYEETYKKKDSVWYSVRYIEDSTQINTEGWKTKKGKRLGIWNEYLQDGTLLYSWDHDKGICEINKSIYLYHDLVEKMKVKADSLLISTYSNDFFENYVRFNYECSAYDKDGYVGGWIEPLQRKPTRFLFWYSVKLPFSDWYDQMIGIELDENGRYIPNEGLWDIYGFEKVNTKNKTFQISRNKAMNIAKEKGLKTTDPTQVSETLKWEGSKKKEFYNGHFRYYITELKNTIKNEMGERTVTVYKYNIYSFNPWTGEFIEKKKMKKMETRGDYNEFTSDLIPDN